MTKGRYEDELSWAKAHPEIPASKTFLNLAGMYASRPDRIVLALIESAAEDVRKLMAVPALKEEIMQVIQEAVQHRVGDFNDHEVHLLMKREIDEALSKYLAALEEKDNEPD